MKKLSQLNLNMKNMKNQASKFGRYKYKKKKILKQGRGKYNNTENIGFIKGKVVKIIISEGKQR